MRQVLQNLEDDYAAVAAVPCPRLAAGQSLILERTTLVSADSELILGGLWQGQLHRQGQATALKGAYGAGQEPHRRAGPDAGCSAQQAGPVAGHVGGYTR